jgi:hypothetical protein
MKSALLLTVFASFLFGPLETAPGASRFDFLKPLRVSGRKTEKPERDPTESVNRAKEALNGFFQAASVEAMAGFVRHPDTTLPRMKAFYGQKSPVPRPKAEFTSFTEVDKDGITYAIVSVSEDFREFTVWVEVPKKGKAKVDWESVTGWSEIPWTDFLKKGSEKPVEVRVRLEESDYYNWTFSDEKKYACYRITDREGEEAAWCYCERDSILHKALLKLFRRGKGPADPQERNAQTIDCTLRVMMKAGDAAHRQGSIDALKMDSWRD